MCNLLEWPLPPWAGTLKHCLMKNDACSEVDQISTQIWISYKMLCIMKMWRQFHATGNQCQAFPQWIYITSSNCPGKGTNTALSYEHPEIPDSSWFAMQHDFLFCLCLWCVVFSKATAAGERCWCQDAEARHGLVRLRLRHRQNHPHFVSCAAGMVAQDAIMFHHRTFTSIFARKTWNTYTTISTILYLFMSASFKLLWVTLERNLSCQKKHRVTRLNVDWGPTLRSWFSLPQRNQARWSLCSRLGLWS